jgi:hypothetical protein
VTHTVGHGAGGEDEAMDDPNSQEQVRVFI